MEYLDSERFKNHEGMRRELTDAGTLVPNTISEAGLVHLYDITFLVGRWDFVEDSRRYRPKGTRITGGPYQGHFPPNAPKQNGRDDVSLRTSKKKS